MKNIGFIGATGLMGHGMAKNLLAKGFDLSLTLRRNHERVADLLAAGARAVTQPAELGHCDAVIICVTGTPQVEEVVAGPQGLLTDPRPGLIIVDSSTSEPESSRRLFAQCQARGVSFVDAPLARTPVQAELGMLNSMVGAEPAIFAQIRPVLQAYSENVFHIGGPGAGHIVKLLNNFIGQAICTATAEAFAVGALAGVNPAKLVELISAGPVNSGLFQAMAKSLQGDFTGIQFELDNARKDLRYYNHLAEMVNAPSIVGEAVHQGLVLASALGEGRNFVPGLVAAQEKLTGAKIIAR